MAQAGRDRMRAMAIHQIQVRYDATADRLRSLGFDVDEAERATFPSYERFHTVDAHGNRVEVLASD